MTLVDYLNSVNEDFNQPQIPGHSIVSYAGLAEQEALDTLLEDLETRLEGLGAAFKVKKRAYHISVEMLQNAFQYLSFEPTENDAANKIFFTINHSDSGFHLCAVNLVKEATVPLLEKRIKEVNSLSAGELKDKYREILKDSQFTEKGGGGLGFYDMARKSGEKLVYSFNPKDSNWAFFSLNILIPFHKGTEK